MKHTIMALVASLGLATSAQAVTVDIIDPVASPGPGSVFYQIDLTTLGLSQISWIEIEDPGTNASARQNSGFDLDAMFIDADGDHTTTGDQTYASSFDVTLGTASNGASTEILNNTDGTNVDFARATLNLFDGRIPTLTGFFSMGDNGIVRANFDPVVPIPAVGTLFLLAGELGDGEVLSRITISDTPSEVPLPAGGVLLLTALGAMVWRRKA